MYRGSSGSLEFRSQGHTPSKRSKYDSFTPRKRYVKEQEEVRRITDNDYHYESPHREEDHISRGSRIRNMSSSRKQVRDKEWEESNMTFGPQQMRDFPAYNLSSEQIEDSNLILNPRPSLRKERLRKNCEERGFGKRIDFEDQNKDRSNCVREKPTKVFLESQPLNLTPRKYKQTKENVGCSLTEKMTALQSKIARLERMTPQRPSTPRSSRVSEQSLCDSSVVLFTKQEPQKMVNEVSEKQSELLSRVSLGRLVEEEETESQFEVIQDLSYKISSKLKSIIRNFS